MVTPKTALVLGATGGIGGEVARQLRATGWQVRALARDLSRLAPGQDGLHWIEGDAMQRTDVIDASRGCAVLVHAVNPPGYQRWAELVLPMLDHSLAAARASGARLVLPGTVYNYAPDSVMPLEEEAPQRPLTRKGAIRVAMEQRLHAAAADGVRSLIVRAGDFFGPRAASNWFSQGLVPPRRPVTSVTNPGRPGVGHQWGYLPDVARTMVALLEREAALDTCARFHMAGHWDADGQQMAEAIRHAAAQATGGTGPKRRAFPWWALTLGAPFVPLFREMNEMRYLWQQPLRLDNTRLRGVLGHEPHTPLAEAVHTTLVGLGCLPSREA